MAEFASTSSSERDIVLISGDSEEFRIPCAVGKLSALVQTMIGDDEQEEEKKVPLPNVKKDILAKVLEYCTHYIEEPMVEFVKPLQDADLSLLVQKFYVEFINSMSKDDFYHLTLAANYMDIKPLLDLCCAKIASMIKGKTPEEIRVNLDITNDFTPEEEAKIREENKWAEDL